ncbi:hypothetical protein Daus18300_010055 [Diaporthe australafricana]|uniref:non-specific serine/threonine protein kinase n=1 Tax=Diaporthe australafricana TaxID=127596 RepID=A0ABR3WBW5_9PEZI
MSRLPDLVRDTKLDTIFDGPFTVHHFDDSDDENDARSTCRSESWGFVRQLGRGGFSEVLLQKCEQDQRGPPRDLRAVKVIQRSRLGDNNLDYMNELEAISKFSQKRYSKCFVKFLGWYDDPKSLYIAMEYFPLGDLQKYMSNSGPMPEADTQEVVCQILEGLCFMHREDFAHRDVKPGNILIKARPPERRKWWVKLSDFGISKRIEESAYVQSTIKGTPPYMAPELVFYQRGSCSPIDHQKADMWALGEMSFRMLTKKATFVDLSAVARYSADPELFPSDQLDHHKASPEAKSFIRSLLELRPNDRLPADKAREHSWIQSCGTAEPQHDYDRPRPLTYPDSDVILIAFAIDSPDSLESVVEEWIDEVLRFYNGRPIILVGCKLDLRRNDRTIEELRKRNQHPVTYEEGEEARKRIGAFMYLECSAKTGEGVRDIFERATRATMYTTFDEVYTDVKKRGWRQRLRTFVYYKVHK